MRPIFTMLCLMCLFCDSRAQTQDTKKTDSYVKLVTEKYESNALKIKEVDGKKNPGGLVTGYYMKNKLVLIKTHSADEFAYNDYFFYIKDDSLIYANMKHVVLKEPVTEKEYADYEKYLLLNTDHKGKTNVSKWPLTLDLDNTYYIDNNQVIKYELFNAGKPTKPSAQEIEETTKDLIARYTAHLEEFK